MSFPTNFSGSLFPSPLSFSSLYGFQVSPLYLHVQLLCGYLLQLFHGICRRLVPGSPVDNKICGSSSPLHKMAQYSYPSVSVDAEPVGTGWTVLLLPLESYIFVNSGKVFLYKHITLLAYAVHEDPNFFIHFSLS